jgi:hypothetical protein
MNAAFSGGNHKHIETDYDVFGKKPLLNLGRNNKIVTAFRKAEKQKNFNMFNIIIKKV